MSRFFNRYIDSLTEEEVEETREEFYDGSDLVRDLVNRHIPRGESYSTKRLNEARARLAQALANRIEAEARGLDRKIRRRASRARGTPNANDIPSSADQANADYW